MGPEMHMKEDLKIDLLIEIRKTFYFPRFVFCTVIIGKANVSQYTIHFTAGSRVAC